MIVRAPAIRNARRSPKTPSPGRTSPSPVSQAERTTQPVSRRSSVAVVLTQTMLWTRYPAGGGIKPHVAGPESGDLVVVTDDPVVRTIADGRLTVSEAMENGLIRLYGTPEQERAFAESYGELGAEPLPAANDRMLVGAMLWRQRSGRSIGCAAGECGFSKPVAPR